jgi:hypothetical protein
MKPQPYRFFAGGNFQFLLGDMYEFLNEVEHFKAATPNNKYLYNMADIIKIMRSKAQGVLLIGTSPANQDRPIRGITIIWDHSNATEESTS